MKNDCFEGKTLEEKWNVEQKTESYYKDPKDNIAFERCIEVMSRLIMKYGPGLLEKMDLEKLNSLISAEIESGADKDRVSTRMLGYCKLMTDRK
jgi:hypothetical protein